MSILRIVLSDAQKLGIKTIYTTLLPRFGQINDLSFFYLALHQTVISIQEPRLASGVSCTLALILIRSYVPHFKATAHQSRSLTWLRAAVCRPWPCNFRAPRKGSHRLDAYVSCTYTSTPVHRVATEAVGRPDPPCRPCSLAACPLRCATKFLPPEFATMALVAPFCRSRTPHPCLS